MIFQGSIELNVDDKNVYAVVDFDTGLLGFVEIKLNSEKEYTFPESPVEFRKALLDRLTTIMSDSIMTNFKICRKNPKAMEANALLRKG